MAGRKSNSKEDGDKVAEALDAQIPKLFGVRQDLLQTTINTLAELPYKTVGDLLNKLRACRPVADSEDDS